MNETKTLRYEDAAVPCKVVADDGSVIDAGWWTARSGVYYSERTGEHAARYHDATDFPCDCGGRHEKSYTMCPDCRRRHADAQWHAAMAEKGVDWDGKTPLCDEGGNQFLWDADAVAGYIDAWEAGGNRMADVRLVLAKADDGPRFEMADYLCDSLPDGGDVDDAEINKTVNDWIKSHAPFSWWPTGTPVRPESLGHLFVDG